MRILRFVVLIGFAAGALATVTTPVSAQLGDDCTRCPKGGVSEDGKSVFAQIGRGGTVLVGGTNDGCRYWPLDGGSPVDETGEAGGTTIDGVPHVLIGWDCNKDGILDGQALVPLVTPVDVARLAFERVEELLPTQDIVMMLDYGVSQSWTPLGVGTGDNYFSFNPMSWEPVSATATVGAITATTTATPLRVEWDTGNLNGSTGNGDLRYWTCEGPGDTNYYDNPQDTSCKAWYMTSSAGQTDLNGALDRVSLTATVYWQVTFTTNIGFANPGWFVHDTFTQRDNIRIVEIQSVIIE